MSDERRCIDMSFGYCIPFYEDLKVYCSWVEERLIPNFGDYEIEFERAREGFLDNPETPYNPQIYIDYDDYEEDAYDHAQGYISVLAQTNGYMLGMAIAGLYHMWEKQLIQHLEEEMPDALYSNLRVPTNWEGIKRVFKAHSTPFEELPFYDDLNELRLVTNVAKHGSGSSFKRLQSIEADILSMQDQRVEFPTTGGTYSLLRADIYPREEHYQRYKKAVLDFWDFHFWKNIGEIRYFNGG